MIDPSLIVAHKTMKQTFTLIKKLSSEYKFYFPASFKDALSYEKIVNNIYSKENSTYRYFLHNAHPSQLREIKTFLEKYSNIIAGYEPTAELSEKHRHLFEGIYELSYNEPLSKVLFEEWVFLQEFSWIVSRLKKPFNTFIDAGAVCLHFGKKTVENLMKRTLKKNDNEILNRVDQLRAFGKWIAVGGGSYTSYLEPSLAAMVNLGVGFFLLFDPDSKNMPDKGNEPNLSN